MSPAKSELSHLLQLVTASWELELREARSSVVFLLFYFLREAVVVGKLQPTGQFSPVPVLIKFYCNIATPYLQIVTVFSLQQQSWVIMTEREHMACRV